MAKRLPVPVGERFGHLTVLGPVHRDRGKSVWLCRCDCGTEKEVVAGNLLYRKNRKFPFTCGCKHPVMETNLSHGHARHGGRHPLYRVWVSMRDRCRREKHPAYASYGGRGITVCERWDDFEAFLEDMGEKPGPEYSLDRIDNDGPYSPENCRWATAKEQARNRRPRSP